MPAAQRRKGREAALQLLYQMEVTDDRSPSTVDLFWAEGPAAYNDPELRDFAESLAEATLDDVESIDATLGAALDHWDLHRLSRVDRCLLRLAVCELQKHPETPGAVVLNEAIEIARKFSDGQSARFVNGVLDRIAREAGRLDS